MFLCNISGCSKAFRHSTNLSRHKKQCHLEIQTEIRRKKYKTKCLECDHVICSVAHLRKHLETEHGKRFTITKRKFDSTQEFFIWKSSVESMLSSCFIEKRSAIQMGKDGYFWNCYYCNRSGSSRLVEDSERKRARSLSNSSKIGHYCTATITTKTASSGQVLVEACLDHYGHQLDYTHLRTLKLPKLETEEWMEKVREREFLEEMRAQQPVFHSSPQELFPEAPSVAVPLNIPPPVLGVVREPNYDLETGEQIRSTQLIASKEKVKQIWSRTLASLDSLGEDSLESLQKALGLFSRGADLICPGTMVDSPKSPEPVARKKQVTVSVGPLAQKRKKIVGWSVPIEKEREESRETSWGSTGMGKTTPGHFVVVSSLGEVHPYANS